MRNKTRISRRRFLFIMMGLGLANLVKPYYSWAWFDAGTQCNDLNARLVKLFWNQESAKVLGLEYLRSFPQEADKKMLIDFILFNIADDHEALSDINDEKLRELLELQARQDFEEERIVKLRGWMISLTEARLCALVAL